MSDKIWIIKDKSHTSKFFQMNNDSVQDGSLSWNAKGLHAFFISMPATWMVRKRDLYKRSSSGRRATDAALKELEDAGYVAKTLEGGTNYRRHTRYTVYETPPKTTKQ